MKIYSIYDEEFKDYGRLAKADYSKLLELLKDTECPDGVVYRPSIKEFEELEVKDFLEVNMYGGMPIQIGYCNGHNSVLNALEYHKSSEINVGPTDCILVLGKMQEIEDGVFDTAKAKAFLLPAGVAVEIYATSLHYAPWGVDGKGFQIAIILPKGTNYEKPEKHECPLLWGSNKWLLAHPDSPEAKMGAHIGLKGENLHL